MESTEIIDIWLTATLTAYQIRRRHLKSLTPTDTACQRDIKSDASRQPNLTALVKRPIIPKCCRL
jgi:hypothetical protein